MMYSCGHNSQGERNYEYEALEPWQRMPSSTGLCPKCLAERNLTTNTNVGYWHGMQPTVQFTIEKPYPWEGFVEKRKVVVPKEMLKATTGDFPIRNLEDSEFRCAILEAALRWEVEHLPLPSLNDPNYSGPEWTSGWNCALEAVRRMFLKPEPSPEEKREAAIRQEARRWCLEEFERASKGESMEVGSDVYDVYWRAMRRWDQVKCADRPEV